ncbi:MAG: DUF1905 domain-containing protein [Bacteroidia bacterium]
MTLNTHWYGLMFDKSLFNFIEAIILPMTLQFKSKIQLNSINPYILVSKTRAQKVKSDWKKPMPVIIRINKEPVAGWKINMMPKGDGSFYLYLNGQVRKVSGTKVGDTVNVQLSFDNKYKSGPIHPMLPLFRSALSKSFSAKKTWIELPPSRKKEILRYLFNLKTKEAQERNVNKAIFVLSGNKSRFMAKTWNNIK